jgi:S-formylglutathione hydrolase FrmB
MSVCRSMTSRAAALLALTILAVPAHAGEILPGRLESRALGRPLDYAVYRPDGPTRGLPVVYLLHGRASNPDEWLRMGMVKATADRLIAEGRLAPLLVVLPAAGNTWYAAGAMQAALVDELPAAIEATYGTATARTGRAVAGNSMGGFGALRFAFGHPERYAAAASMSGAYWTRIKPDMAIDAEMEGRLARVFSGAFGMPFDVPRFLAQSPMALAAGAAASPQRPPVFLTVGRGDRFGLAEEQDAVEAALRRLGHDVTATTTDGDHDWGTWEAALPEVLVFLARYLRAE